MINYFKTMSLENGELRWLEDVQADFEEFLKERKFEDCREIIKNLMELGYERQARVLGRELQEDLVEHQ